MRVPAHPTIIKSMCQSRVNKLKAACPVLAASLVVIEKTCGHPGCRCQHGEKHTGHYLTFKQAGKTKTVYVPLELLEDVEAWVKEHQRIKQLSSEISQLTIALIRSHVRAKKRRKPMEKS